MPQFIFKKIFTKGKSSVPVPGGEIWGDGQQDGQLWLLLEWDPSGASRIPQCFQLQAEEIN